jgi:hypothetical protein
MTRTALSPAGGRKRATAGRRRAGLLVAVAVLAAVASLVAACGGGGSHTAAGSSQNGTSAPLSAMQSGILFLSCIRAHGVPDFPGSAVSANDGQLELDVPGYLKTQPQFQSALRVCQKYLPRHGSAAKTHHVTIQRELSYARCMRSHGITNFADPLPGGGFNFTGDTSSPQFQAADNACRVTLGSSGPNG